ncbi:hypothetical protein ACFLU6_05725, partial [Acidobacteriota bacterium]
TRFRLDLRNFDYLKAFIFIRTVIKSESKARKELRRLAVLTKCALEVSYITASVLELAHVLIEKRTVPGDDVEQILVKHAGGKRLVFCNGKWRVS